MANSKYEYVKSYEVDDEVFLPNFIVVQINGRGFKRFLVLPSRCLCELETTRQ